MIYTVTWNPAIDRVIFLHEFVRNISNRTTRVIDMLGGKGTHVSANLRTMGTDSILFGLTHGVNGERIQQMLEDLSLPTTHFYHYPNGNTRMNYLLVEDSGDSTLVTERGVQLSEAVQQEMVDRICETLTKGDWLVLSGDASNCSDPWISVKLIQRLRGRGIRIFLDTSGVTLRQCVQQDIFLMKPNLDELSELLGRSIGTEHGEIMQAVNAPELAHIPVIAVSMGGFGSLIRAEGRFYQVSPAPVSVVNTVGCGDCFLAGMLHGFSRHMATKTLLQFATACAGACAESPFSYGFDLDRALALMPEVNVDILD